MSTQEPLPHVEDPAGELSAVEPSNAINNHFQKIIFGVVGFLVLFALILWWKSSSQGDTEESWGRFQEATTAEEFESIAADFPDTPVATWSTLMCGEVQLQEAASLVFSNRAAADDLVSSAEKNFDSLIDAGLSADLKEVTGRAVLGKARALEMTGNDIEGAIAQYEIMQSEYKDLGYEALVKDRLEALNSKSSKGFYAWFKNQKPEPSDQPGPSDGNPFGNLPPNHPSMQPITLPQIPPEMFPNDWNDLKIDEPIFEPPKTIDDSSETTEPVKTDATEPAKTGTPAKAEPAKTEPAPAK